MIQAGPLLIPLRLLVLAAAGVVAYFALFFRLKAGKDPHPQKTLEPLVNVSIMALLIWKFSLLIVDPGFVIEHPLSLLYFWGGDVGLAIAGLYALGTLGYRTWKLDVPPLFYLDAVLTLMLAGGGTVALLTLIVGDGGLFAGWFAVTAFILYYVQLRIGKPLGHKHSGNVLTAAIVFVLAGWAVQAGVESAGLSSSHESAMPTGHRIGNVAVDFGLSTLDGEEIRLSSLQGRKVLLNFWATWCPPCKAEMPHLEKFYQSARAQGFEVLAVNLTDTEKSAERVAAFAEDQGLTFPIVLDESGQVRDLYRVRAYPTSLIIDSHGVIRGRFEGAISYDTMKKAFRGVN